MNLWTDCATWFRVNARFLFVLLVAIAHFSFIHAHLFLFQVNVSQEDRNELKAVVENYVENKLVGYSFAVSRLDWILTITV